MRPSVRSVMLGFWLTAAAGCGTLDIDPTAAHKPPAPIPSPPDVQPAVHTVELPKPENPPVPPAKPAPNDAALPINLPTALQLSNARPLVIAAAQASLRVAAAQYDEAKVLWLPNFYFGGSWYRHDGLIQGVSGNDYVNGRNQYVIGGGLTALVSTTDAIFAPLAARQVVRSRASDVEAARNDALLTTAEAYFNVQQARGQLAGAQDTVEKARQLVRIVSALSKGLTPPVEADRAAADLADLEQNEAIARSRWREASAQLARALLLPPNALVAPLEPPHLQVTLIAPNQPVDKLIGIGLSNRPELASQQALVQATLVRLRQERMRPLIPNVIMMGDAVPAAPGGLLMGGLYGTDVNGSSTTWGGRGDVDLQLVWELRNLGLGNRALVKERQAERDQAVIESYRIQTRVASEVVEAQAQLESAAIRVGQAEKGLKRAQITFAGNLKGVSETTRFGDLLVLVNRPQEVVAALRQLSRAYDNYFLTVNDYNRAQFRLFRALGYAAEGLNGDCASKDVQPSPSATLPPPVAASDDSKN